MTATLATVLRGAARGAAGVGARARRPGTRRLLRPLVTLPLVLPPVVGGVALLLALGRSGLLGPWLSGWFGIELPFTTAAVVLAETFVAMPFLVIAVEGALRSSDRRYEDVAADPGCLPLDDVPPGHAAARRPGRARRRGAWPGPGRWASSARPSRSPAASRAPPRRCRWRSTSRCRPTPTPRSRSALVLLAVSVAVLVGLRERWTEGLR